MSNKIVEVRHLSHRYSVDWAIRDINFEIKRKACSVCLVRMGPVSLRR